MRARVLEREELTTDIEESDLLTLDLDESCLTGHERFVFATFTNSAMDTFLLVYAISASSSF